MYKEFSQNNIIGAAILIFLIVYSIFVLLQPSFLFTKNGQIRHFGIGKKNSSIIPIWLLVIIIVIFIYMSILCYLRY
jgi:hypothetical protein